MALKVGATSKHGSVILRFPWTQPTAAAAYRRGGALWLVFDRTAVLDLEAVRRIGNRVIATADQVPADDGTVVRLSANAALNPDLRREGDAWIIEIKRQDQHPKTPVGAQAVPQTGKSARFVVPLAHAGHKVVLNDPDVGDALAVVPVLVPGQGIEKTREYPLFRLLATAQGVAIESKSDSLEMRATPEGLEIMGSDGLFLSQDAAPADQSSPPDADRNSSAEPPGEPAATLGGDPRLFDFAAWGHADEPFEDARQALQNAVVDAAAGRRNEARMTLAKFYFARGFAADAMGLLQNIAESEPRYEDDPVFRGIRGASRYLMGDPAGAAEDLSVPALAENAEAKLWRGAVAAAQAKWPDAVAAFSQVGDRIQFYPPDLKVRFALLAAETALISNEFDAMMVYLDFVAQQNPDAANLARRTYLLARTAEKRGNVDDALKLYAEAAAKGSTETRVRATFDKVALMLSSGKMSRPEAIKELEGLRY
ncbi:MAG: hypothetical protein WCF16_04660, partial [Alphaproteobacteria bacterium]